MWVEHALGWVKLVKHAGIGQAGLACTGMGQVGQICWDRSSGSNRLGWVKWVRHVEVGEMG